MQSVDWYRLDSLWPGVTNLEGVWLFGSSQAGFMRQGGDIDIGVLFSLSPALDLFLELRAQIQDLMQVEAVDLVDLLAASPILRFEAVRGRRLYARNPQHLAEFVSLTAREYEDEMAQAARYWGYHNSGGRLETTNGNWTGR